MSSRRPVRLTITTRTLANAYGVFGRGDKVEWPEHTARPVIASGNALEGWHDLPPTRAPGPTKEELSEQVDHARKVGHPLTKLRWGSDEALEEALIAGLSPDDFEGVEPGGSTGYVAADVRAIIKRNESEEE